MDPTQPLPPTNGEVDPGAPPSLSSEESLSEREPLPIYRRKAGILALFFILLVTIAGAAAGGYFAGTKLGDQQKDENVRQLAEEQFALALEDLQAGRYEIAKQRLEYVSRLDPNYPGVAERLAQALLALNAPTATPRILATPTPNLAPVQEMLDQAKAYFSQEQWSQTIDTLIALRAKDPDFRPLEVDRMLFSALRNRGVHRISNEGRLEEGIYDLSRAKLFGPLDRDANNWRSWAELYLIANSYMGLDWAQATFYFSELYLIAPYLKNDTYLKYATSARAYGDQLYADKDPCGAQEQYQQSLSVWENSELFPTATKAAKACLTATAQPPAPPPTAEESLTPEVTSTGAPTSTPTPTPSDAPENGTGSP